MNPHQLELFYHVARCKGVSRAAREMPYGIQQPSVSAQVNALERDLGVTLYERRPFKLTAAGAELFEFVAPFFGKMAEARERLQGAARIRVGASPIAFRDYLPPVFEAVRARFPGLNMTMRAVNQPELMASLESDGLDAIVSLVPEDVSPGIRAVEIVELPLVLLVRKGSKIKRAGELWIDPRAREPLISLGPGELISQMFQRRLGELGVAWLPKIEMDSLELIESYAAAGYGAGLSVSLPGKRFSPRLKALELADFPAARLGVLYRESVAAANPVLGAFLEEIGRQAARFRKPAG